MSTQDWPPDYADPIVLRLRFVSRAPTPRHFPEQVGITTGRVGVPTDAEIAETLRQIGYMPLESGPSRISSRFANEARSLQSIK